MVWIFADGVFNFDQEKEIKEKEPFTSSFFIEK